MHDHTRYEVQIKLFNQTTNIYVAVSNDIPENLHDKVVHNEIMEYIEKAIRYTYSQKLF